MSQSQINPAPENDASDIAAANINTPPTIDRIVADLESYVTDKMSHPDDGTVISRAKGILGFLPAMKKADPDYIMPETTKSLIRQSLAQQLSFYPAAYCIMLMDAYDEILKNPDGSGTLDADGQGIDKHTLARTLMARLQIDVKEGPSKYLYAYISNVHSTFKKIGINPVEDGKGQLSHFTEENRSDICSWLCDRMKVDVDAHHNEAAADILSDIMYTMDLHSLKIAKARKPVLYAAIVNNGLDTINASFCFAEAADPDQVQGQPDNQTVSFNTLRALTLVGMSKHNIANVTQSLTTALDAAKTRQEKLAELESNGLAGGPAI